MIYSGLMSTALRAWRGVPPAGDEGVGLVLVADGVGGAELCATALTYAVPAAGLGLEVRSVRWGHGLGRWYVDLVDLTHRRDRALAMAAEVVDYRDRRPGRPVFLVGKSGGAAVVVEALAALPDDAVEAVVLLAPALSPGYDLGPALRAVRRELVVFWSPLDWMILGLGTLAFGTADRVRSPAAGLVGFRASSTKLRQVRWRPAMGATGYWGGHLGIDLPSFLGRYVAPLLVADDPTVADQGPAATGR